MDWFVKSQNNKDDYFYDYTYMCDLKKDILTVYYYGKKLFSIIRDKIEYYKYIFANEEKIYNVICYNEKQANNSNDWLMAMKKLCRECNTIEQVKQKVANFKPKLYIDVCKFADCWQNSYIRKVKRISDDSIVAEFVISKLSATEYRLSIKYPYCRETIMYKDGVKTPSSLKTYKKRNR